MSEVDFLRCYIWELEERLEAEQKERELQRRMIAVLAGITGSLAVMLVLQFLGLLP